MTHVTNNVYAIPFTGALSPMITQHQHRFFNHLPTMNYTTWLFYETTLPFQLKSFTFPEGEKHILALDSRCLSLAAAIAANREKRTLIYDSVRTAEPVDLRRLLRTLLVWLQNCMHECRGKVADCGKKSDSLLCLNSSHPIKSAVSYFDAVIIRECYYLKANIWVHFTTCTVRYSDHPFYRSTQYMRVN